ncbi:mitochondrial genome maintenance protein Mgr2 [Trichoderma velutinum]
MPPVAPIHHGGQQAPSTFDKLKMGAMMGGCKGFENSFVSDRVYTDDFLAVGVIMGFIFGTVNIFRYGAGSQGIMRTLGQYMGASGATFGFFMGVGSVIRSDADPKLQELYMRAQRRPIVLRANSAWRRDE